MRQGKWGAVTVALVFVALAVAPAAQATVTIGSNLANPVNNAIGGPGTWANSTLPASSRVAAGLISPVNGTVTTWRVKWGSGPLPVALRVIRPVGENLFTGAGTSEARVPAENAISAFSTQLPIGVGDWIGLDSPSGASSQLSNVTGAVMYGFYGPPLTDSGAGRSPTSPYDDVESLVNADIEPTSAFTIGGVKKLKGGKLQVTATLPNAGTLSAGDRRATTLDAGAAKGAPKLLKRATTQVTAPGQATLTVKPTKAALAALKDATKIKAKLKISFTPNLGSASIQLVKTKLKR